MNILLTGGTGFLGRHLVQTFLARGDRCVVISRGGTDPWRDERVTVVRADPTRPGPWQDRVAVSDAVVNLAGALLVDPPHRWTRERKELIRASRVETTRRLSEAILAASRCPAALVSASAVHYYYGCDEEAELDEHAGPGDRFPAPIVVEWEAAARQAEPRLKVTLLRIAPILAKGGGLLERMVGPFRLGVGGPWGNGRQWWPWIHLADAVGVILLAIDDGLPGPVNLAAPGIVRVDEFAHALGHALHRPAIARVPAFALRLALGEAAAALLASLRVVPRALLARGYAFRFPDLAGALADIF